MKRIIIFASGNGSNAENIIQYFKPNPEVEITHIFSNNKKANVLKRAVSHGIQALHFDRESLYHNNDVLHIIKDAAPDIIVLAGFLWKFPENILDAFPNKVINVHPALLPKYGGKGMYGKYVHEAVVKNREAETGITIHYVNENYDEGAIIFQTTTKVDENDSPEEVAQKVHQLEYKHFPIVIDKLLRE